MIWEPRPLPEVTPETAPFWEAATDGRFLLRQCTDCDLIYYYPRSHCPDSLSDETEWIEAAGTGEVYSYTATEIVSGWPENELPLVAAYVELEEGPRLFTNLVNCKPADVDIGMHVKIQFIETKREDIAIPVFEPIE